MVAPMADFAAGFPSITGMNMTIISLDNSQSFGAIFDPRRMARDWCIPMCAIPAATAMQYYFIRWHKKPRGTTRNFLRRVLATPECEYLQPIKTVRRHHQGEECGGQNRVELGPRYPAVCHDHSPISTNENEPTVFHGAIDSLTLEIEPTAPEPKVLLHHPDSPFYARD